MFDLYNVLIIEDEPIMCQYYSQILKSMPQETGKFKLETVHSFDTASNALMEAMSKRSHFDLIILDIRLRDIEKRKTYDGEELGVLIRKSMPKAKIMVITSHDNNFRYHTILQRIKPDGFMVKYELNDNDFKKAIKLLLKHKNYFGLSVTKYLNKQIRGNNKIDDLDKRLLSLLTNCLTTKEIASILPLSPSGIEKRKRNLSKFFNLENAKTVNLVRAAKEYGYID